MGLTGKITLEMEIKSPADKYFSGWTNVGALFCKAIPDDLHKSEVLEGDGKCLNSISSYTYVLHGSTDGSTAASAKTKVEALDEEKKSLTLLMFDGHVGELYRKYKLHIQVFTKDGKNLVLCIIEYEKLNESVPEPINYLEVTTKVAKGLDAHLLQA